MEIAFVRLTQVPLDDVVRLLNEPRIGRHLPLAGTFTRDQAQEWVATKDAQWATHGYGPWAVLLDGVFGGWAGFQREQDGADLGLVLLPDAWGHGAAIARTALDRGFGELGLAEVVVALPLTRRADAVVARYGFRPDGRVVHGGVPFQRYRLTRERWAAAAGPVGHP